MQTANFNILTINGGSSSIKFAMFQVQDNLTLLFSGSIKNINSQNTFFNCTGKNIEEKNIALLQVDNFDKGSAYLLDWLEMQTDFKNVKAVGHRVVHGMQHTEPLKISLELLEELKQISLYDPEHLPAEIKLIELFVKRHPALVQIACFDTSFHTTMPHIAKLLPIPLKYFKKGIQRYGFHGLSYAYLMQQLQNIKGINTAKLKIILAHLGNGASLAAVKNNQCIDTSMGFTPASGLIMGTRTGDLDPGVAWYLMQVEKLNDKKFNHLINHESGLIGLSETSADMQQLIKIKNDDSRAAAAFKLFCYQAKKYIGSYAAALDGLDIIVFSGGIGENSPEVRMQICTGLNFLGIELDEMKNKNNELVISTNSSKATVYVIKTNEELMIAQLVRNIFSHSIKI